jgi:hypothetical protein
MAGGAHPILLNEEKILNGLKKCGEIYNNGKFK